MQSALDRRTFLSLGIAGGACALGGFEARGAVFETPILLKPFAHSPTVTSFAQGLFFLEDLMPRPLRRLIEAELDPPNPRAGGYWKWRSSVEPELLRLDGDSDKHERLRAAFFARLAVEYLAPLALRRAGYRQMATEVANGTLAPAGAQHTIGRQYANTHLPKLASCAYGASADASTTAFYACHQDIDVVVQAGEYCARALLDPCFYDDDPIVADAAEVWDFAARVINAAIGLCRDDAAEAYAGIIESWPPDKQAAA